MATGTVEGRLAQLGIALPEVAPAGAPFRVWCVWYRGVPRSPYIENIPQRLLLFFGRADSITQDESPFVAAMQYCSVPFLSMRVRFTRDAVGVVRVVGHLLGGARAGNYVMYRRSGNILYLSGHLPKAPDGTLTTGKVSCELVVRHVTYTSECVLRWRVLRADTDSRGSVCRRWLRERERERGSTSVVGNADGGG